MSTMRLVRNWKRYGFTLAVIPLAACLQTAGAGVVLAEGAGPGGHRYAVVADTTASWTEAAAAAKADGGFLATIGDAQEQSFVEGMLAEARAPTGAYWFGLRQSAAGGDYRPPNGTDSAYSHFLPGQPDDNTGTVAGGEDSGHILWSNAGDPTFDRRGFWNDLPDVNPTRATLYPDLARGGYLVEFLGTGPAFDNGDGDGPGVGAAPGPGSTAVPLPAAVFMFPAGVVLAAVAARRFRRR